MPKIIVSSQRVKSILTNRNKDVDQVKRDLSLKANLTDVVDQDSELEFSDIEAIAKYFKKPWSYLLIDEPEVFPQKDQDNRTHQNRRKSVSADIVDELQIANFMLDTAIELFPDDKILRPEVKLNTASDIQSATKEVRRFLGVPISAQVSAKNEYEALRIWVDALQNKGVYVSQRRLRDKTIRAFSLTREDHSLMVVDTGDSAYARIFSMLHEYCHILLRTTGICDLDAHSKVESFCNQFSADLLLPREILVEKLKGVDFSADIESDEQVIKSLSSYFKVSQAAILIKLQDEEMLPEELYARLETRRRNRKASKKGKGGDFYRSKINAVGKKYAQNVFGALSDDRINRADASVLLGVGEHLVDRFRNELFHPASKTKP